MIFLDSQSLYKYLFHISLQALCHFNVIINMNWQSFYFKEKIKQGALLMVNRRKISIIGAGHTGGTLAFILAQKELAEIVLIERQQSEGWLKERR